MGRINYGRVVLGGVVAGVVFLLMDFLGMHIVPFDWMAWAAERGLTMPPVATWIVMDIVIGILAVWLYAAIRPRFGAGVKTAVMAGVWVWLFFSVIQWAPTAMGLWPMSAYWAMAAWGLVQTVVAVVAGAWVYREEGGTTM
ncbi:MAG TPA: hypothetical protein VMM17_08930 [Gemmatimonadaceae bacterium]|nr:hypothetical protein [Gemmatimonadaceae bacterium]